ncbi:MAG: molybdopterin-dependent oxidoreductase [Fimbriimonadaceae bacterium]|nr:molybdopterin-dependent oxidoreductase [Fimbriimonadaceae bacterium]
MADPTTAVATVTITVDGVEYQVPAGILLIDAITDHVHFDMPRFCHHSRLEPVGMCRMCMAEVEARGRWANVATCTLKVADGMRVRVSSEAAQQARKMTLELLLVNHPLDCPVCDKGGECMLQDQTVEHGPEVGRSIDPRRKYEKPVPISSSVLLDRERCVHCARCTRFVDEVAGEKTIELVNRGYHTMIAPAFGGEYDSHFSGNTCDICPVGALTSASFRFGSRPWEMVGRPAISPFDAGGANLRLDVRENVVRRIMPRANLAVNDLWISDKDRFHHAVILDEARLDVPLVRNRESGELEKASWDDALHAAVEGLAAAVQGDRAVVGIGSTVLPIEDQYLFQKVVREVLQSPHVLTSQPVDYERRAALVPTYAALGQAQTFFFGGANPLAELPLAWLRIYQAIRKKGARLLTLNNRDYHVGLASSFNVDCQPGAEAGLVKAVLHWVTSHKRHDATAIRKHSKGFSEAAASWGSSSLEEAAAAAGADPERVVALAEELLAAPNLVIVSPQMTGRPDGTALRDALWNLALLLNVAAQEHGGWLEQVHNCNGRGAADMGLRGDYRPCYQPVEPPGYDLPGFLAAATAGEVGAALICGSDFVSDEGNPFQTVRNQWLNQSHNGAIRATFEGCWAQRRAALEAVPFVVVSELFLSQTAALADVVLPATCFAERPGTLVNCEGRAQSAPAAVRPILGVRSDVDILNQLAAGVAARLGAEPWQPASSAELLCSIAGQVAGYGDLTAAALAGEGLVIRPAPPAGRFEFVPLS